MYPKIQSKQTPIAEHQLDIGNFIYYPNIIIGEFAEGVHACFENTTVPVQIAAELYSTEKPWVYISNRVNSYSVDPLAHKEAMDTFPNFKAFVVVAESKRKRMLANLESLFVKKPMRVFDNLQEAMTWAENFLKTNPKL